MRNPIVLLIAITCLALSVQPAFAMKGHAAAVACERNPKCHVIYYPDGGIEIYVDGYSGWIVCTTPHASCTILQRKAGATDPTIKSDPSQALRLLEGN